MADQQQYPVRMHKGDQVRLANSVADVVRFQFDGFTEAKPTAAKSASASPKAPFGVDSDPADYTVPEVKAYLEGDIDDAERERVLSAEESGKARATLLG